MEFEQPNTPPVPAGPPSRRNWILVGLALLLIAGAFRFGYVAGQKGYVFVPKDFKIINREDQPVTVDYSLLWEALDIVNDKYIGKDQIDEQKVLYGAIRGAVAAAGDEYTEFFD